MQDNENDPDCLVIKLGKTTLTMRPWSQQSPEMRRMWLEQVVEWEGPKGDASRLEAVDAG
jgi:hypothetical protein